MRGTSRSATCARSSAQLRDRAPGVEFNIEGDPRPDLLALVHEVKPDQCTLVPVKDGEITSQAGWPPTRRARRCSRPSRRCSATASASASSSIPSRPRWSGRVRSAPTASSCTPSRSRGRSPPAARRGQASFDRYAAAANLARSVGLGVNAGHDLDLDNLDALPHAAASRRSLDRPCADQPRAVCGVGAGGEGLPRCGQRLRTSRRHRLRPSRLPGRSPR